MLKDTNIANFLPIIFAQKEIFTLRDGTQVDAEFSASTEGCDAYFKMPDNTEIDTHLSEALFSKKDKCIYIRSDIYDKSFMLELDTATVRFITDILTEMEECTV